MKKMKFIPILVVTILMLAMAQSLAVEEKAFVGIYPGEIWGYEDAGVEYGIQVFGVVDESPAQEAGMQKNDIILEFDGAKLFNHDQFTKMLKMYKPGQKIKLKIYREGDEKTLKLTLANKEDFGPKSEHKAYLGVFLTNLSEKDYEKKGLNTNYGVLISDIVDDGPSAEAGIKGGDVMLDLEGQHVYTSDQISKMLGGMEPEQSVTIDVFRSGEYKTFTVVLGKKEIAKSFLNKAGWFEIPSNVYVWNYRDEYGKWLGLQVEELDDEDGLLIKKIYEGSPADGSLLQVDDIIIAINGIEVDDIDDIDRILDEVNRNDEVVVDVLRDGDVITVTAKVGERSDIADQLLISVESGNMKVTIDGDEKKIIDLEKMLENINKKLPKDQSGFYKLDSLQDKLKDLKVDVLRIEDSGAI